MGTYTFVPAQATTIYRLYNTDFDSCSLAKSMKAQSDALKTFALLNEIEVQGGKGDIYEYKYVLCSTNSNSH